MVMKGLSVDDAIRIFGELAKDAFTPRRDPLPGFPFLSELLQFLVSYFADGKYPSTRIEAAFKCIFGEHLTMFDCSHASATGAKIAVLVTSVAGCRPFLCTNYQGKGLRRPDCGKSIEPSLLSFILTAKDIVC
jgi:hypothetical protein